MTKRKSLGQIAYDADTLHVTLIPWDMAGPTIQRIYERMAQAVALEVKRQRQRKKP